MTFAFRLLESDVLLACFRRRSVLSDRSRLELGSSDLEELAILARESRHLEQIVTASGKVGPVVGTGAIADAIASTIKLPKRDLRFLFVAILNLFHTKRQLHLDSLATVTKIGETLTRLATAGECDGELAESWEKAISQIARALDLLHDDHPLEGASKAIRVVRSRQYDFVNMKVFADIRPVFNEQGTRVVQSVIAYVLSLDYHDGSDHRVIQLTLDAQDIAELKKECERAELKGAVLKGDLKSLSWPTSIFREPPAPVEPGANG